VPRPVISDWSRRALLHRFFFRSGAGLGLDREALGTQSRCETKTYVEGTYPAQFDMVQSGYFRYTLRLHFAVLTPPEWVCRESKP
jgi:hypothetical protein